MFVLLFILVQFIKTCSFTELFCIAVMSCLFDTCMLSISLASWFFVWAAKRLVFGAHIYVCSLTKTNIKAPSFWVFNFSKTKWQRAIRLQNLLIPKLPEIITIIEP